MKFPLRSLNVCAAVLLCLGTCRRDYAQENSLPGHSALPEDQMSQPGWTDSILIPGPLRSFLRMAGISQDVAPDDVVPTLARNASLYGYDRGKETEFLVLLERYVHLARELQPLADASGNIQITGCDDATRLIQVLGYKLETACGQKDTSLMTADAERAFLTIDSGFPLSTLEAALQKNEPFSYSITPTRVPIFYKQKDWLAVSTWEKKSGGDLLDLLLHDQNLDRLYGALARYDQETRVALGRSPGLKRMMPLAAAFDLFGGAVSIRSGRVVVPAGNEKGWEQLVEASPRSPGEFVAHMFERDSGWLAAYFDVLSRLNQTQQAHLGEGTRLTRLYNAYRSTASRAATAGVYPRNAGLLMLLTSLRWEENGDLLIPGGIGPWEQILSQKSEARGVKEWVKRNHGWDSPERLLETLVACSNVEIDNGPVQIFLMLSALDAGRPSDQKLSDATEQLIAGNLSHFHNWFPIFAEFPSLDEISIDRFVSAADRIEGISNQALRANALGVFQADIGLWQILARQGQIPKQLLNSSWQNAVEPFIGINSSTQLFEAARASLQSILLAGSGQATGQANLTQDQVVDLLAGPSQETDDGQRVHQELADRIRAVMDDQRLVTLETLFGLYDGLTAMAHGAAGGRDNLFPLAENLREFEMPRPVFTGNERAAWSPTVYTSRHAELQVRTDIAKIIRSSATPSQLENARGKLTPFLRDTLVGLNYAYFEPPGAEVLHNNPLFVRSHDFSAMSVEGVQNIWREPSLIGVGATAGGGAYMMGSLAGLPYALASTEEDFIAPKHVQALIWQETVPELLVSAILPRWWTISRNELHAVALHQRFGEELLAASTTNSGLRTEVLAILYDLLTPDRMERTERALVNPEGAATLVPRALPAELFYLAVEFRRRYPKEASSWGQAGRELEDLFQAHPSETDPGRLSADFGVPHPTLTLTNSCTLMNMKPVPAYAGSASRLFAESWESNNLYWARLADEKGYSPVMLNILVPTLTRRMIVNIFASNIDDWRALLRAMEETGEEFRQDRITIQAASTIARQ
jgi:hypothetical protein